MVSQNDPAATPTPDGAQDYPQEVAQTSDAGVDVDPAATPEAPAEEPEV